MTGVPKFSTSVKRQPTWLELVSSSELPSKVATKLRSVAVAIFQNSACEVLVVS